jgi:hypothetical protein
MATNQGRPSGNGHVIPERGHMIPSADERARLEIQQQRALPPVGRPRPGEGMSTGEALAAVARDAIDVASELVRDGVALGRLEAQKAVSEFVPRAVWGLVAFACGAVGAVLAIIAIMMGLGALIPSVPARLGILAGVLFVVAFFGAVRVMRPGSRGEKKSLTEEVRTKESPATERREPLRTPPLSPSGRTLLPPGND